MRYKKLLVAAMSAVMVLSGCNTDKPAETSPVAEEVTTTAEVVTTIEKATTTSVSGLSSSEPRSYGETAYPDALTLIEPDEYLYKHYDVSSEGLPQELCDIIVNNLQNEKVMLALDKNGNYRLVDGDKCYNERILGWEQNDQTLELFPENIYICLWYLSESAVYDNDTVISESLNRIFTRTESNTQMYNAIDAAKESGDLLYIFCMFVPAGTYAITITADQYFREIYNLGESSPLNDNPDMPTRTVYEYGNGYIEHNLPTDNPYEFAIETVAEGYCGGSIFASRSDKSALTDNDAVFGDAVEISHIPNGSQKVFEIKLSFRLKAQENRKYEICRYNAENGAITPINTYYNDETNEIYTYTEPDTNLTERNPLGTFCLCKISENE